MYLRQGEPVFDTAFAPSSTTFSPSLKDFRICKCVCCIEQVGQRVQWLEQQLAWSVAGWGAPPACIRQKQLARYVHQKQHSSLLTAGTGSMGKLCAYPSIHRSV